MQPMEQTARWNGAERTRMEAVGETLTAQRGQAEKLAEVAHDARNMVTALGLYCDLLEEPGVLATPFVHYGTELRLVAAASHRLVDHLVILSAGAAAACAPYPVEERRDLDHPPRPDWNRRWEPLPAKLIDNLANELQAARNLLAALAGPAITLSMDAEAGGGRPVRMTGEDLTRVLVNLVKNAAEAMPAGGRIQLGLRERPAPPGAVPWLALTIEDNGPGIPLQSLDQIFNSGFTSRSNGASANAGWPNPHRGLGLFIARSIVEAAGGRIHAANRPQAGARFEIELPVRSS